LPPSQQSPVQAAVPDGHIDMWGGYAFFLKIRDNAEDLYGEDQGANFSIFKPGILSKSLTSEVTTEKPREIQVAPIIRS
jgi:hypothetical protein